MNQALSAAQEGPAVPDILREESEMLASEKFAGEPLEQKKDESGRVDQAVSAEIPSARPERTLDQLLKELDALVGLQRVKDEVRRLIAIQDRNRRRREKHD